MAAKLKEATPDAAPSPVKKGPPMMIIVAVVVVLAIVGTLLVAKKMFAKAGPPPKPVVGDHIVLDEFLVNLADGSGDRYLKTTIALGLDKSVGKEAFAEDVPATRDAIVMVLTSKHLDEIRSTDGKDKLKKQLLDAVNKALPKPEVLEVDFQSFATQ
jgi:flagellar basal body-associated protein FliL